MVICDFINNDATTLWIIVTGSVDVKMQTHVSCTFNNFFALYVITSFVYPWKILFEITSTEKIKTMKKMPICKVKFILPFYNPFGNCHSRSQILYFLRNSSFLLSSSNIHSGLMINKTIKLFFWGTWRCVCLSTVRNV